MKKSSTLQEMEKIHWNNSLFLPSLHNQENQGLAGTYSGFINNTLIILGGANFPDAKPWEGGKKEWWNTLYAINPKEPDSQWTIIENFLPTGRAYGITIELSDGILCIGGCDATQCYSDVFQIQNYDGSFSISDDWPSLPMPLANAAGVLIDNKIYVAGGQTNMDIPEASSHFFILDISNKKNGWTKLKSWPGEPRGYAVCTAQSDGLDTCLYLFSGRDYNAAGYLKVLTDGYAYNIRLDTWEKLDQVFPVMAGTAIPIATNHILLFGGVTDIIEGSSSHPGFDKTIRLYHTITNTLVEKETVNFPIPVTTNAIKKENTFYLTSGETKPGTRTKYILSGKIVLFEKNKGWLNILVVFLYFISFAWIGYSFYKNQKVIT